MSAETNSIQELYHQGMPVEDIAMAMGLSTAYVKSQLNMGADMTEQEASEIKNILLDIARGQVGRGSDDSRVKAAIYLRTEYVEEKRIKGTFSGATEVMAALKLKAAEKMKRIQDASVVDVAPSRLESINA